MDANKTKLIAHRWDLHTLQALSRRNAGELVRVFKELKELPDKAVDIQVQTFGFGAPMQFHSVGFFDKTCEAHSDTTKALFERVVNGDTLLQIALRHYDPRCAAELVKLGASLRVLNTMGESPLRTTFDAMAFLRLHPEAEQQGQEHCTSGEHRLLEARADYEVLFRLLHDELQEFHDDQKAAVERGLLELYQQFAPDRISKIPSQLETFVYREDILLDGVRAKYLS